jgi:hypothetical protein
MVGWRAECARQSRSAGPARVGVCEEGGVAPSGDTIAKVPDYAGDQIQRCARGSLGRLCHFDRNMKAMAARLLCKSPIQGMTSNESVE